VEGSAASPLEGLEGNFQRNRCDIFSLVTEGLLNSEKSTITEALLDSRWITDIKSRLNKSTFKELSC
jgi:hypothetical protein